MRKNIAAE